jgi:hypothetical protein
MRIKPLICALAVTILASPAYAESSPQRSAALASLRSALETNLRDYPSARFRDAHMESKDPWTVCGYVNSKNAYGGYAGWQRFFAMRLNAKGDGLVYLAVDDPTAAAVAAACDDPKDQWSPHDISALLSAR